MNAHRSPFLMWYDDSPKLATTTKVAEAVAAYHGRFRQAPNLVLVHEADLVVVDGLLIRAAPTIHRNTFWVGREVVAGQPLDEPPTPAPAPARSTPARPSRRK